jgi:ribonuclease HI
MERQPDAHGRLVIWQHNVNKSPACQHTLLSNDVLVKHDIGIVALQEPVINFLNNSIASKDWISVYPTTHCAHPGKTRTLTLIRSTYNTDSWEQIDFPSGDVTIIALKGTWGKLILFNIYNEGNRNDTIHLLKQFHRTRPDVIENAEFGETHILWVGDFNRHHPHWDDPNDTRLFTPLALRAAEVLIEAVASLGLELALPSGLPTHLHNVTKKWSRLDQVFISDHSTDLIESCDTETRFRSLKTDHLPVVTKINLEVPITQPSTCRNFREVDWEDFHNKLAARLSVLEVPQRIQNQDHLNESCESLISAIQATMEETVPTSEICSKSKRWWTKELTRMRRRMNKIGRESYKHRDDLTHPKHEEHAQAVKLYDRTVERTKRQHWRDWLERAVDPDIWTVHKYTSAPASDGAKARIPALKHKEGQREVTASTNHEKAQALAKSFFPTKPAEAGIPENFNYPKACCQPDQITKEQIAFQIRKLKPYKAPGPDGIPNIVLIRCADLLIDRLYVIYKAMLERNMHYAPWKTFTTVVLRKPGKPRYDVPKAYRPIALLNTTWKVLAAVVADQLTFYSEKYQLIPAHHFGGRPGRTTTDAIHLLIHKIKLGWRNREVSSVLFLDVEGAFPNAVPERLTHNLRKRGIPRRYSNFVAGMLEGRITSLKFDDHVSDPINIDNGIGQGDPLSMVLYQYYNADILDVPTQGGEAAIAYVDDALILATAKDFTTTHQILTDMMTREGGIYDWSQSHNSPLEHSKLALIDFAHRNNKKERPNLPLPNITVTPTKSTKYLGIIIDQHLDWKAQHAQAIEKGSKWASQIKRLARPSWGITPKYARRLYIGVALPRILYGADVWCGLPAGNHMEPQDTGSAKVIRQITTIQRSGAIAITGALRTSPTDALDVSSFLLPAKLTIEKWCHRAAVRLATLPPEHPLYKPVGSSKSRYIRRHRSPLHTLFKLANFDPKRIEKIPSKPRNPALIGKLPFKISIPPSKEASIAEDRDARETLRVYSDGSANEGKVGAAAVLIRPGEPHRTLHFHLGSEEEHTVHEAELIGLILALHLIRTEKRKNTPIAIGTDNHAALKVFQTNMKNPAHNAAREILRLGTMLQKNTRGKQYSLTLRWTAGHVGIQGNELADKEAKRAAEGLSSDKSILPTFAKRKLTINPSAVLRKRNTEIQKRWVTDWKNSTRGQRLSQIDNKSPSAHFLSSISNANISRRSASLVTQLYTGHVPLNEYLNRFKLVDSSRCPACGARPETVRHFLLECPIYAHERWLLKERLSKRKKALTVENLLGDAEAIVPLTTYISASHRFPPIT